MIQTETHIRVGGEMKDKMALLHATNESRQIQAIAFKQFELRIFPRVGEKFRLTGGKIVPPDDGFAVAQQAVNQVAADETRRAGDKDFIHD